MEPEGSLTHSQVFLGRTRVSVHVRGSCTHFVTGDFLRWEVVSTSPNPKLEDHPLSAVRDCLFNIFAAILHTGGRSSIRNWRTCHAVVTGTHLSRPHTKSSSESFLLPKHDVGVGVTDIYNVRISQVKPLRNYSHNKLRLTRNRR